MDRATVARSYNALAALNRWPVYCDATLSFDCAALQELCETLEVIQDGKLAASRADLTARVMKNHIPHMTIYEHIAGARWRVRLMGTRFAGAFGELTGKIIDEGIAPSNVVRFEATLELALRADGPLRFLAQADIVGRDFLVAEYLVAPLLNDAGERTMVLSRAHFLPADNWQSYISHALERIEDRAA
jgi:hypothetical protein